MTESDEQAVERHDAVPPAPPPLPSHVSAAGAVVPVRTAGGSPALVIALVVSNVVTLLALAVCITLLVASGHGAMEEVQAAAEQDLRDEAELLRELYLQALERGQPGANSAESPPPQGLDAWKFTRAEILGDQRRNRATFVSYDRSEQELLAVGDELEGLVVQAIEPNRVVFLDETGKEHVKRRQRMQPATPEVPFVNMNQWDQPSSSTGHGDTTTAPSDPRASDGEPAGHEHADAEDEEQPPGTRIELEDGTVVVLPPGVDPDEFDPRQFEEVDPQDLPMPDPETQEFQLPPQIIYDWMLDFDAELDKLSLHSEYDLEARRYTGVRIRELPPRLAHYGLKPGDVLVEVNGYPIEREMDLVDLPRVAELDEEIKFVVRRNGIYHEIRLGFSRSGLEEYVERVEEHEAQRQQRLEELRAQLETGATDNDNSDDE